ncbi:MAG: M15 family metallopeptidase [Treponema sp.]
MIRDLFSHRSILASVIFIFIQSCIQLLSAETPVFFEPPQLHILRSAYPDIIFRTSYDFEADDWKIEISGITMYWADGKMLTAANLNNKDSFWPVLYKYTKEIPDPAVFTPEHIQEIRSFTAAENRREQEGTSPDFFNAVYDSATRRSVEQHIMQIQFLGKKTNVHERIVEPLHCVEKRILTLAQTDADIQQFIDTLARVDSYNWREIGDRSSRSFHSYGIAVDILPEGWNRKNIYWAWRRDIDPHNWMLLPLDRRWMPPEQVIDAFEKEGFVWGGKWIVWDNMHFEYHPELIDYNHIR